MRNKPQKPINNHDHYKIATNGNTLAGGRKKNCKKLLGKVSQNTIKQQTHLDGEESVTLAYDVKKLNRLDCASHLNSQTATFQDVGIYAFLRQRLKESTIEKHLRYARFMEAHKTAVDFRNPSFENFIRHMDYREQIEQATPNALCHEWKAMQTFLKAYGIPFGEGTAWDYKPPSAQRPRRRVLPLPDVVNKFFTYEYAENAYERTLLQYLFFHSYLIGWRVPSEIVTMKVDDVHFDAEIPHIIITEPKKRSNTRPLFNLEPAILSSPVHKSFKNWLDHWRPKVENQYSGDSLYLWPSGKPLTVRTLGHILSIHGKRVWEEYRPYDMRHWCAIARLIKSKVETKTFDVFHVQKWLGHETITTTNTYISQAISYYNILPVDWVSLALKPTQKLAGKRDMKKINRMPNLVLSPDFSPVKDNGPVAI